MLVERVRGLPELGYVEVGSALTREDASWIARNCGRYGLTYAQAVDGLARRYAGASPPASFAQIDEAAGEKRPGWDRPMSKQEMERGQRLMGRARDGGYAMSWDEAVEKVIGERDPLTTERPEHQRFQGRQGALAAENRPAGARALPGDISDLAMRMQADALATGRQLTWDQAVPVALRRR
jgi:hypothetical protein